MHPIILDGDGASAVLLIADHASNRVPPDIDLGVAPGLLDTHIAIDLGNEALTRALAARLEAPAVLADVSRLVIDLNRDPEASGLIPAVSDGKVIPGNHALDDEGRDRRLSAYHQPYHEAIKASIAAYRPELLIAVHSFTPSLSSRPDEERPWHIGILHNRDARAAAIAITHLRAAGLPTGDNEPYSGRLLNYTMDRHAEGNDIPYLGLEIRQDLLQAPGGIARWTDVTADLVAVTLVRLKGEAKDRGRCGTDPTLPA